MVTDLSFPLSNTNMIPAEYPKLWVSACATLSGELCKFIPIKVSRKVEFDVEPVRAIRIDNDNSISIILHSVIKINGGGAGF